MFIIYAPAYPTGLIFGFDPFSIGCFAEAGNYIGLFAIYYNHNRNSPVFNLKAIGQAARLLADQLPVPRYAFQNSGYIFIR
jgi:hypothetical protein